MPRSLRLIRDCVWTSAVDVTWTVAIIRDGKWWASGGIQGQVRVWEGVHPHTLHLIWQAHTDFVYALAFSPDGRTLASGSQDGTIKLWEVGEWWSCSGQVISITLSVWPLALMGICSPAEGMDATVRVWDPQSGTEPANVNAS